VHADAAQRKWLEKRLANLSGVAALIRVGGATDAECEDRRLRVDAALKSKRLALLQGVVPGGGVALIKCAEALTQQSVAERMLKRALACPLRDIANGWMRSRPYRCPGTLPS
jgi:chaperonin GroEL